MTRQQMYYYIKNNGVSICDCNLENNNNGSIYYMTEEEMKSIVLDIIKDIKAQMAEKAEENENRIMIGDKISALGYTFTVNEILYQEFWRDGSGYDCEFLDNKGKYHHWKQWEDGGFLTRWNGRNFERV